VWEFVEALRQHRALLDDGDQHLGRHGNPYLRLHGVLAGAEEGLDAQVLLDPLEQLGDILPVNISRVMS
jgi:hypothetical protein